MEVGVMGMEGEVMLVVVEMEVEEEVVVMVGILHNNKHNNAKLLCLTFGQRTDHP